jgi:sialate O-acetylesterase
MKAHLLIGAALFAAGWTEAGIQPAFLFQDGMILQQGKAVPIWGTAEAGTEVTVEFAGQRHVTSAGSEGHWRVNLDPLTASAQPREMIIAGDDIVTVQDVLVGEVWVASGQSNMEWRVRISNDADLETLTGNWPHIREINLERATAENPQTTAVGRWIAASPTTVSEFSAVAYAFARDLHQTLGVPVGILNATWGGTPVEAWMPAETLAANAHFPSVSERWNNNLARYPEARARFETALAEWETARAEALAAGEAFSRARPSPPAGPGHPSAPARLYNGMIHPLAPYAVAGFIWYQGESNASRAGEYHVLFSAMIEGWRERFNQGDLPFFWVQLAGFRAGNADGRNWAFLREAQTRTLALPATGQAVILDVSDVDDIHPREKRVVGRRLARLALNRVYGKEVADTGPRPREVEVAGDRLRVHFSNTNGGLTTTQGKIAGFELAAADGVFHPARAEIAGPATVEVSAEGVPEPAFVRYAWRNAPGATLMDRAGFPAEPFRTDAFPE